VGNIGSGKLLQIDKISSWQKYFGKWTHYPISKPNWPGINRAEMRLAGPIRISASTQANIGRLQLILGFTEAQFRYLPNLTITRRQPVSFTIPKVSYPVPGGRYVVRGLPDGLTFDPETLEVSGTTDDVAQIYQIEVEYLEPGDG